MLSKAKHIITCLITCSTLAMAQPPQQKAEKDSTLETLQQVPAKYIKEIDKKIEKYKSRISNKTEKTLLKLSKWETKIKTALEKADPQLARRLFANPQFTFSAMLQQYRSGENIANHYKANYDAYTDKLKINLKYLDSQKTALNNKIIKPLTEAKAKLDSLSLETNNIEALQQLIKERKKQLVDAAVRTLGNNKYLLKIGKETWYYAETMRNYKSLFNDQAKAEQTVKGILNKIPAFKSFAAKNSQLAAIFGLPRAPALNATPDQIVNGLQPRANVIGALQTSMGSNTGMQQMLKQNVQNAHSELNRLKDELIKKGGSGNELDMPDFKPNMQKTKTFWQRMEYTADVQFAKHNSLLPTTSDISLGAGYKLDNKKIIGIAASYRLGWGSISRIKFTNEGMGLRSYLDWKLKKQLFVSGGFEMNYNSTLTGTTTGVKRNVPWQKSALLGLTKKIKVQTKWFKATKLQLLFDFLSRQHMPVSQPILFRAGYNF